METVYAEKIITSSSHKWAARDATGPMGLAATGSVSAEDGGLLWVIKIRSAHFLRRGSNAVGPVSYICGM
jgi:hypothetical protein